MRWRRIRGWSTGVALRCAGGDHELARDICQEVFVDCVRHSPLPDVLTTSAGLVGPGQSERILFTAPGEPGDYPFLCTFPGHWRLMHGVLRVVDPRPQGSNRSIREQKSRHRSGLWRD